MSLDDHYHSRTNWESFYPRMFYLLVDEHGARSVFIATLGGSVLRSRGSPSLAPTILKDMLDHVGQSPTVLRRDGAVFAFVRIDPAAMLIAAFDSVVLDDFAAAALQSILLVL